MKLRHVALVLVLSPLFYAQQQPAKKPTTSSNSSAVTPITAAKFKDVQRAAIKLKASLGVGVSYKEFGGSVAGVCH